MEGIGMPAMRAVSIDKKDSLRRRFFKVARSWLVSRRLPLHLFLAAIVLTLPALLVGFQLDDYEHRLTMLGLDPVRHTGPFGFLDVYTFFNGDPSFNDILREKGKLPWWASSQLRLSFFRPLSALTMWADYQLWPDWPSLMHLQSIFWYAAVAVLVTLLYRRMLGQSVMAGLAAMLYVADSFHAIPASWLANRNALLCVFFGVLCLLFYDRWRRENKGRQGAMAAFCFALALLSGESALATAAYLFAYALFLDNGRLGRRLAALAPFALILALWAALCRIYGFGSGGSGFYIDPLGNPGAFLSALVTRVPLLLMGQWTHIAADSVGASLISEKDALILAAFVIAILAIMLLPLVRKDKLARFWLLGMLLSMAPIAATDPMNRLLCFAGLGAMGLMAQFICHLKRNEGVLPSSRLWRRPALLVAIYLLARFLFSLASMPVTAYIMKPVGDPFANAARAIPDDEGLSAQDLIIVNPPNALSTSLIWQVRLLEGKTIPARVRKLADCGVAVEIYRLDERTLRVRIAGGLFSGYMGSLFRSPQEEPMGVNEEFRVPGMTVRVVQTGNNGPEEMEYRFTVPLEHASFKWIQWENLSYSAFVPPAIGRSVALPSFNIMSDLMSRQ